MRVYGGSNDTFALIGSGDSKVVIQQINPTVTVNNGATGATGATGAAGTSGSQGATGLGGALALCGSFYDTTTQTSAGVTAANVMTYNTTDFATGISIQSGSRITITQSGTYNIQFSAQIDKTDSGIDNIEIWLSKNGTNVPDSSTTIEIPKNDAELVAAWNWLVQANSGDYYEIVWNSDDATTRILARAAQINPTRPAIPSVILTVSQVTYTQIGPTGPTGPVGGATTQVIFNDAGVASGDSTLTFNKTTKVLSTTNITVGGTASNVIRRAYGLVAFDTGVTLDEITASVTSSTSQLKIENSASWQGTGWTETYTGGTPAVQMWVNLPINNPGGYANASGAMNSQGNGCRCVISDQTPSAKSYQITVVRSGTSGSMWNISIERLV
jgi:hypothetical protein